jgi:hypothetical protein
MHDAELSALQLVEFLPELCGVYAPHQEAKILDSFGCTFMSVGVAFHLLSSCQIFIPLQKEQQYHQAT